jgi:hypothetical protein
MLMMRRGSVRGQCHRRADQALSLLPAITGMSRDEVAATSITRTRPLNNRQHFLLRICNDG